MEPEKEQSKGKTVGIVVGVIAAVSSYFIVQQFFRQDVESELKKAVVEINKQTPMSIDAYTRLDSVASKGKTNFIYYYTLIDLEKSEVNLDTVNKYIRPSIIENIKSSPDLKVYRDNNITMDYKYYDKNGTFALDIAVTPDLYKSE